MPIFRSTLVLSFILSIAGCGGQAHEPVPPVPNILFAIADDWGWPHAGAYGDPVVETPVFDRLAREGVLFHHAYISAPSCTPSRAAILTGQWHWRLRESANLWSTLAADIPVYPDLLEEGGYFVGYSGKGWGPGDYGVGGRSRNPAGPQFESFTDFMAQRPQDRPFAFWFGTQDPHRPYVRGSGEKGGINARKIKLFACFPDSLEVRGDVADYYWEVQRFDRDVGSMLIQLEKSGELDNTVVVMTGDHGMPFPRSKGNLYDSGARVPLVVRWPTVFPAGRAVEDFVSLTDLAPTFLELAGLRSPSIMTGRSLLNILQSEDSRPDSPDRSFVLTGKERHVPCQEAPESGGTPMRAIRTHDYLYIRNYEPERWPAGTPNYHNAFFPGSWYGDCDNGPTKSYMINNKDRDGHHRRLFELAFAKRPGEELYDLKKDPDQLVNVAADPAYAEALGRLAEQLEAELKASRDPRTLPDPEFDKYPYYGGSPLHPDFKPNNR